MIANKFEFKTQEGTYLHAIWNFSNSQLLSQNIDYKDGKKNRGLLYYSNHIMDGIGSPR
jgi:hypothetical protein